MRVKQAWSRSGLDKKKSLNSFFILQRNVFVHWYTWFAVGRITLNTSLKNDYKNYNMLLISMNNQHCIAFFNEDLEELANSKA